MNDNKKKEKENTIVDARKSEWKKNKPLYLMLAPFFVLFACFTVFPVVFSIIISLTDFNVLQFPDFVGMQNYAKLLLEDDIFLTAVKNTFIMAIIVGPIGYMLAFVMAWMLCELPNKLRVLFTIILYGPSLSGNAYMIWTLIFSDDSSGYANSFLISKGLMQSPVLWLHDENYMMLIVILVQLWMSFGVGFLSFIAGLQGIDQAQIEAGMIDGIRNRWQELWHIVLPSMKPVLLFGAITSITSSLSISGTALTGFPSTGYATHTIIDHLNDYGTIRLELGYASAIAVVLFFIMIICNRLVQKFIRRVGT